MRQRGLSFTGATCVLAQPEQQNANFFYDLMHIEFEFTYAIDHEGTSCSTEAEC